MQLLNVFNPNTSPKNKMDETLQRHHQPALTVGTVVSSLIPRSKSSTPDVSPAKLYPLISKSDERARKKGAKSMTNKSGGSLSDGENANLSKPKRGTRGNKETTKRKIESVVKLKQQQSPSSYSGRSIERRGRARSASTSPSAWALSPGRASHTLPLMPDLPVAAAKSSGSKAKTSVNSGGGVTSKVLKFFTPKKMTEADRENYHQFKLLHNRLLQWRFVNAKAEFSMSTINMVAEGKLFNVWLQLYKMRNYIVERCIEMQKMSHEIKLYEILNPELMLLDEWSKMEKKHYHAVGRVVRKLSAISLKLPLGEDVKGDVVSVYAAMSTATVVMDSIEEIIADLLIKIEMLNEIFITVQQEHECVEELSKLVNIIVPLEENEESLRAWIIQAANEQWR